MSVTNTSTTPNDLDFYLFKQCAKHLHKVGRGYFKQSLAAIGTCRDLIRAVPRLGDGDRLADLKGIVALVAQAIATAAHIRIGHRQNEDVGRVFMNLASRISQVLPRFRTDDIRVPIQLSDTFTGLSLSRFMNLVEEDYERSEKVVQLRDELIKQLRQARRAHLRERFPQLGGGWTE